MKVSYVLSNKKVGSYFFTLSFSMYTTSTESMLTIITNYPIP
jgi:hypothetical protein